MKRTVYVKAFCVVAVFCGMLFTKAGLINLYARDKIIAIVNKDVVTEKDLLEFTNFMRLQLGGEFQGKELEDKIESMKPVLLDKLIEDRLILQEAKKNGITVDEARIEARLNEIKSRYPSESRFQVDLARQGLVQANIEEKIREQMLMYYVIDQEVRSKIVINPEEVTDYYNKNIKIFVTGEARELDVITLENKDQATSFSYNLRRGEKLEDLAARYPIKLNNIRITEGEELKKEIEEVVPKMGIGEISKPIEINGTFYVFRLNRIIPPRPQILFEVQDQIYAFLFNKKMQVELTKWINEIKEKSYIKITQD